MDFRRIESPSYIELVKSKIVEKGWSGLQVGKITSQQKGSYTLKAQDDEFRAELLGQLLYNAESKSDLPVVGDWVAFAVFDQDRAIIHGIFPRKSTIERINSGTNSEIQIIASNLDAAFIVMGADRDFNLNRVERYLTLCHASGLNPVVIITKIDLLEDKQINELRQALIKRLNKVPVYMISSLEGTGMPSLQQELQPGKTYCLLGSSGAGKSTLINTLAGQELMSTSAVSSSVSKGKHTTTHRQLIELPNGSILIDNPGLREVGIGNTGPALENTFEVIEQLANQCKFRDCKHLNEPGCQVLAGLENGIISQEGYENYQKLLRETAHYGSTEKERRRNEKSFSKLVKTMKKQKRH